MLNVVGDELEKRVGCLTFARLLGAYLDLSESHKATVNRMVQIVSDASADLDERERALDVIMDALSLSAPPCPGTPNGSPEGAAVRAEMDREQDTFATRLRTLLAAKGMTQINLAARIGVHQSAISMLLNRNCRPQRSTVEKLARALEVTPEELWPETPKKRRRAI
jgi:lambda repressor-like predicted transcriptional regulator